MNSVEKNADKMRGVAQRAGGHFLGMKSKLVWIDDGKHDINIDVRAKIYGSIPTDAFKDA